MGSVDAGDNGPVRLVEDSGLATSTSTSSSAALFARGGHPHDMMTAGDDVVARAVDKQATVDRSTPRELAMGRKTTCATPHRLMDAHPLAPGWSPWLDQATNATYSAWTDVEQPFG